MTGCWLSRSHIASELAVGPPSSADFITPMLCSDAPSVQPVLKVWLLRAWHRLWIIVCWLHWCLTWARRFNRCYWDFLTWISWHTKLRRCIGRRIFRLPSDAPMLWHRFFRCLCFLQNSSNSAFLWVLSSCFVLYDFFTSSLGSRNVHSTKPLVPLIALSYNQQNHSKWHKWCHICYENEKGKTQLRLQPALLLAGERRLSCGRATGRARAAPVQIRVHLFVIFFFPCIIGSLSSQSQLAY